MFRFNFLAEVDQVSKEKQDVPLVFILYVSTLKPAGGELLYSGGWIIYYAGILD